MDELDPHAALRTDLIELGHQLDAQLDDRDLQPAVLRTLRSTPARPPLLGSWRRRLAAAVTALALTTVAVPPARAAVADLFRIGAVEVAPPDAVAPSLPPAPTSTAPAPGTSSVPVPRFDRFAVLGPVVSVDDARATLPLLLPSAPLLGSPDQVRAEAANGAHVSLLYGEREGLPALADGDGVGLLVEEFVGDGRTMVRKYRSSGTEAEPVDIDGDAGVYLSGTMHNVFYEDALGRDVTATGRSVSRALIFPRGPLTIRLEADLSRDELVAIARSMR